MQKNNEIIRSVSLAYLQSITEAIDLIEKEFTSWKDKEVFSRSEGEAMILPSLAESWQGWMGGMKKGILDSTGKADSGKRFPSSRP